MFANEPQVRREVGGHLDILLFDGEVCTLYIETLSLLFAFYFIVLNLLITRKDIFLLILLNILATPLLSLTK